MMRFAVVILLWLQTAPLHAQVKIAWKLKAGDRFYVEEVIQVRQTMTLQGMDIHQRMDQTKLVRYTVVSAKPDGSLMLEKKIESVKATTGEKALIALQGAVFQIVLRPAGTVEKLDGLDQLIQRVARDNTEVANVLRATASEDSLKALTESLFQFVPGKQVAKGARWQRSSRLSLGYLGAMQAKHAYTLVGEDEADKNLLKIGVTSEFAYLFNPPNMANPTRVIRGLIRSEEATGTLWFHPGIGRLQRSESQHTLKGTLTLAATEGQGTAEVKLVQQQTTKIRILEKSPL